MKENIKVIIPAFNEENAIGKVINAIPGDLASEVIVVNNASTDNTAIIAKSAGATVLVESQKGYGRACLKGINYLKGLDKKIDIVVFIDADFSDYPEEMKLLVEPILNQNADMVIGSRALGKRAAGSMTFPQVFGNWLATRLLKVLYKVSYTDLGPFRAIKFDKLLLLNMQDKTYGWTVEMQLKAAKLGLKTWEVPVTYRKRVGISKISGTVKGTIMAGYKILWTIFKNL
ncbi:MAG: glycosyltransferase family 2 protein [Bacteroidota bacterium]|nr:glycosyltransferase family 2 protein [Bacteroidota bacterium]